jgi:hypothetical protein
MSKVNSPKLFSKITEAAEQGLEHSKYLCKRYCNLGIKHYSVNLSIPCNIFLPFHSCISCFVVYETSTF